jgi:hypothetical protein
MVMGWKGMSEENIFKTFIETVFIATYIYMFCCQGKPIMARIKAKPMNRLPIPPVPALGAAMKNGYRTPPAALYDPTAYQGSQQRFLYTNGSSIPPTVNYGNQVHVYVSTIHITA